MSARPIIGISSNTQAAADRRFYKGKELEYGELAMARWVRRAGGLPVMVYRHRDGDPLTPGEEAREIAQMLDGLILSAGSDVAPTSYGQEAIKPAWAGEAERDAWEIALYRACIDANLPVLGICRGCQLLNVAEGGTLWQDVESEQGATQHRSQELYCQLSHGIEFPEGTWTASLFDDVASPIVNSVHHQSLREVGASLTVTARAPDGVIEAVERAGTPWVAAVQWHPEWMEDSPVSERIFEGLISEARAR